jgi:thioredoxin reductase
MRRIAIVGAGPVGIEAALAARERGYATEVFERGAIADAVRQWGHVRMFSPFEINATARGRKRLQQSGVALPQPGALVTGSELRERYLVPLARSLGADVVHEHCEVIAIGRSRRIKGDHIGESARGATPFRLLVREGGTERTVTADAVLDCSGTYGQPSRLGDGGIPAPGEQACADRIYYGVPNLDSNETRARYAGRRALVVGAGHSAATAVRDLAGADCATEIHWLLRRDRPLPAEELEDDSLPERARLAAAANRLVREERAVLHRGASVDSVARENGALRVAIVNERGASDVIVDEIIVTTGFRPDMNLARELQVQTCWATEGTYPLAVSLLGEAGGDCLKTPAFGIDMLRHPEPGFFTLGMKSYGRASNFLLRTGYEQVETVINWLGSQKV